MFTTYESKDKIPDGTKPESIIEGKDGKFHVDDSKDIDALKLTNTNIRKDVTRLEGEVGSHKTRADDAERKLAARVNDNTPDQKKIDEMLEQWRRDKDTAVAEAKKPLETKIGDMAKRLDKYEFVDAAEEAFRAEGGDMQYKKRAVAAARTDGFQLEEGKIVKKNEDGTIATQTLNEYFRSDYKREAKDHFVGTKAGGGGAGGKVATTDLAGGDGDWSSKPPMQWTSEQRRDFIEQHGPEAYRERLNNHLVQTVQSAKQQPTSQTAKA